LTQHSFVVCINGFSRVLVLGALENPYFMEKELPPLGCQSSKHGFFLLWIILSLSAVAVKVAMFSDAMMDFVTRVSLLPSSVPSPISWDVKALAFFIPDTSLLNG